MGLMYLPRVKLSPGWVGILLPINFSCYQSTFTGKTQARCTRIGHYIHQKSFKRNLSLSQITASVLILLCSWAFFFFFFFGHPLTRSISPVSLLAADCCFALLNPHIIYFSTCISFSLTVDHMPCSVL